MIFAPLRQTYRATFYGLSNGGYAVGEHSILNLLARMIWGVCFLKGIRLVSEYVGADAIIRSGADFLSREQLDDRCCLRQGPFEYALHSFKRAGLLTSSPTVDLFAEPGFVRAGMGYCMSRVPDLSHFREGCKGRDALAVSWGRTGRVVYAYPPLHLVEATIDKALREVEKADGPQAVILVVPDWKHRHWWPLVQGYPYYHLGNIGAVTFLPIGAKRPIGSDATWNATCLRAVLIKRDARSRC
jgi:hypothetical protein